MALGGSRRDPGVRAVARRSRLAASAAILLLILAACGGTPGSPSASAAPVSTPVVTPELSASPEPTASPLDTPEPTQAAVGDCTPETPTDFSAGWKTLDGADGDYRFAYPPDWITAGQDIPTSSSVSPETFAETDLGADVTQKVDLVRAEDGTVGVSAWVIEGVTSRTDDLYQRELAWLETQPQLKEVIQRNIEACFDGSIARGFGSTWNFPAGETNLVIYMLQRNGKMYEVQLTAVGPDQEVAMTLVEIINSWEWTEPAGPPTDLDDQFAATDFKVIGMALKLDDTGDNPNVADFQSTFPAMSAKIHVIYELDDKAQDTVKFSWRRNGVEFIANEFDYKETTTFAWGWITPDASGKFDTGSYSVTLRLVNSGDTITVPFTIE